MRTEIKKIFVAAIILNVVAACGDRDLEPSLEQEKDLIENTQTVEDLRTILLGGYDMMQSATYYGRNVVIFGEVRSDNAFSNGNSNRFVSVSEMNMLSSDSYANDTWNKIYQTIANANIVIGKEGAQGSETDLKQIKGEAYAMRALAHFDLLRLYGQQFIQNQGGMEALGIPYVTTFRDSEFLFPGRETVSENYKHIMDDLDQALKNLQPSYNAGNKHFISVMAAHAIKARVATYFGNYDVAEKEAEAVVNSDQFTIAPANQFLSVFTGGYTENIIFSIAMNSNDNLQSDSMANIYRGKEYGDVVILEDLFNVYDNADIRKSSDMIAPIAGRTGEYRNMGKCPSLLPPDDDIPIIRYEEVVLIYAEALLKNHKDAQALLQLNKIPQNRNAQQYVTATMDNILLERRKELAFEGFRFDDIARMGQDMPLVDQLKQRYGVVKFGSYKYAFPIPLGEIAANSNVVQNDGY